MSSRPTFRKPLPDGVVEHINLAVRHSASVIELDDSTLMLVSGPNYCLSTNGGQTWNKTTPLNCEAMGNPSNMACLRLQSGQLVIAHRGKELYGKGTEMFNWNPFYLSLSNDRGKTWIGSWPMDLLGGPYHDTLIQLSSGRLVMPSRVCYSNNHHPGLEYGRASSHGTWKNMRVQISGHYHYPEIDITSVSHSDNNGQTWKQCSGQLMGWFDGDGLLNGRGGITAVDEPSVAECVNGRIMLMGRSTAGRLVQTWSSDGGETWEAILPSDLPSSYSPPRLRKIPKTEDLLCVWNQVSRDEIKRGYRRGRLSSAISKDSGASWEHFKTIEVSDGLEDLDRIPPMNPITPIVALPELGTLPDNFATFDYANICFSGDSVYLIYHRAWIEPGKEKGHAITPGEREIATKPSETVLRVYPLNWFYT